MTHIARRALSALTATALLAGLLVGTPSAARAAAVYYVAHDGVSYRGACASADFNTNDGGYDSDDDAIRAAVVAAGSGDTIHICAGTYQLDSAIDVVAEEITFIGDGATKTILDEGARWDLEDDGITPITPFTELGVPILLSTADLTVEAIQFTGGYASGGCGGGNSSGGAICAYLHLTVRDSAFISNAAEDFGGAIGAETVDINGSSFTGNVSYEGGAIILQGGSIANTEFTNNVAQVGGAVYFCSANDLFISNTTFTKNYAMDTMMGGDVGMGSALFSYGDSHLLSVTSSMFTGNIAKAGGTVAVRDAYVAVNNSKFIGNIAARGAALFAWGDGLSVARSTFTGNTTTEDWGGGAINAARADITSSTFTSNTALQHGGAVMLQYADGVLSRNTFKRNSARQGGGAISFCSASRAAIRNVSHGNRFSGNRGKSSRDRDVESGWGCFY
ncbi:MAG: hypothetical protein WCP38_04715 [Chloroflexota bacterium]